MNNFSFGRIPECSRIYGQCIKYY